jgi:tripartite-type tricarboxylate transporter receptor subunit TctC
MMPFAGRLCAAVLIGALCTLDAGEAPAQSYPSKPVRVLTGAPPGGPTELVGRVMNDHLSKAMGQQFYVEGKPGAAGNVAGEILANAPADGHTLYLAGMGVMAVNQALYPDMKFDAMKAFAPITVLVRAPVLLEVSAKLPPTNYKEFVEFVKTSRTPLNHGSAGVGTIPHLAAELFKSKIGFQSTHVPYRGIGPFAQAMQQGELQWSWDVPNTAMTLARNGAVRLLAVATARRLDQFPDVPTLAELGFGAADWSGWFGLVAPAGTPKEIIDRLSAEIASGFKQPDNVARLRNAGYEPATTTPEEMARIVAHDRALWTEVVRANNIKAD